MQEHLATVDLQEHLQEFQLFLAAWTREHHQLLEKLPSKISCFDGEDPLTLQAIVPMVDLDHQSTGEHNTPHVTPDALRPSLEKHNTSVSEFSHFTLNQDREHRVPRKSQRRSMIIEDNDTSRLWRYKVLAYTSGLVICFNSLIIALASEYAMSNPTAPDSSVALGACESACAVYYILEVVLKMCMERSEFWKGVDWKWNVFDLCLALQALVEQVERLVVKDMGSIANLSFVRLLRLVRVMKLFRVIRFMLAFRELRMLLNSLFGCVQSFFWACVLMTSMCFMFGICMMQFCSHWMADKYGEEDYLEIAPSIEKYWSSTLVAMNTLFMSTTSGENWATVAKPIKKVGPIAYVIFASFIALFNFVILNIVNSIFVDTMISQSQRDDQTIIATMLEKREDYADKLHDLYEILDEDGDGEISYGEFCRHIEMKQLRAFLTSMDIDITDVKHFFRVLSEGGKRPVNIDAFISGCFKLRGYARSIDLMDLIYQQNRVASAQQNILHQMREDIIQVGALVSSIRVQQKQEKHKEFEQSDKRLLAVLYGRGSMSL